MMFAGNEVTTQYTHKKGIYHKQAHLLKLALGTETCLIAASHNARDIQFMSIIRSEAFFGNDESKLMLKRKRNWVSSASHGLWSTLNSVLAGNSTITLFDKCGF